MLAQPNLVELHRDTLHPPPRIGLMFHKIIEGANSRRVFHRSYFQGVAELSQVPALQGLKLTQPIGRAVCLRWAWNICRYIVPAKGSLQNNCTMLLSG